jgi:hypothetical protein
LSVLDRNFLEKRLEDVIRWISVGNSDFPADEGEIILLKLYAWY